MALTSTGDPRVVASTDTAVRGMSLAKLYARSASGAKLFETARLAARSSGFPMAQVNVLDDHFQYGMADFDEDSDHMASRVGHQVTPREHTVCSVTVAQAQPLAVDDLTADRRFADLPGVRAGIARSYLGVPLRSREADVIGSLCIMDRTARRIDTDHLAGLRQFAGIVEDQLDLIRRTGEMSVVPSSAGTGLAQAIDDGDIVPWYQPIVDLESGQIHSYEALARWVHRSGYVASPALFVARAEDSDLVLDLDLAIMRQSLVDLRRWLDDGRDVGVNINLSPRHLEAAGGVRAITAVSEESGVDPSRVTLEITESRRLADIGRAASAVGALRDAGFPVVLDDFGTGWSSIDWIMTLPVTGLKIDRSVSVALDKRIGHAVARAACSLARDLDLDLIIEGIGTEWQIAAAREFGYDLGQGYFWGAPVPAETVDSCTSSSNRC